VGSSSFSRQPPQSLEPRLRRRLPAGGRLAPMLASATACSPLPTGSPLSLQSAGLSSPIDMTRVPHQSGTAAGARAASPAGASGVAARAPSDDAMDADAFARLFTAAQQRGEEGLLDCALLLGRLKEWLAAQPLKCTTAAPPHTLNAAATACLQTTLLHFCDHWPTGAALRNAIDNYAALNDDALDATQVSDGKRLSRSLSSSVPLNYAEVALLAAAVMLRSYPAASLVAEPVSFHALITALHSIAECGVAEWLVQESQVMEVLMEVLLVLTAAQRCPSAGLPADTTNRHSQWTLSILDIFACCCEEAAVTTALAAISAEGQVESRLSASRRTVSAMDGEQDMIRGRGFAEDADVGVRVMDTASSKDRQQGMRVASASATSSVATLHRMAQPSVSRPGSRSPLNGSTVVPQGSPLSLLRSGSGDEGGQRQVGANPLETLTTHLVSLGLPAVLQELSTNELARASAPAAASSSTGSSLLPVVCSLFRLLAQLHAESLRCGGVVETLVAVLQADAADTPAVESAARALIKLTFDDASLQHMQASGTTLLDAATHALLTQMRLHPTDTASKTSSIDLLVTRLCGVVARVAEGSAALQEHLATPAVTHVLEVLAHRYLSVTDIPAACDDITRNSSILNKGTSPCWLPPTSVLQSIIWVFGMAAMSPQCSLHFVETVTPQLVGLLQRLRESSSAMPTTAVYVLMCLSNLSYFFNRFEPMLGDTAAAVLVEAGSDASAHAEWLSTICDALCFSLAAYLFEDDVEATVEATRILGNISYTNTGRDWMETSRCDEVIVLFLGHEDLRIVYNCCGILLNLTAASPCRVVGDPELLQMMLSYTARYTKDDTIAAAAALEKERLSKQRLLTSAANGSAGQQQAVEADQECALEASSSANQIADVVGKLLMNVQGLLSLDAHAGSPADA
jgi:hypothetical protein